MWSLKNRWLRWISNRFFCMQWSCMFGPIQIRLVNSARALHRLFFLRAICWNSVDNVVNWSYDILSVPLSFTQNRTIHPWPVLSFPLLNEFIVQVTATGQNRKDMLAVNSFPQILRYSDPLISYIPAILIWSSEDLRSYIPFRIYQLTKTCVFLF